MSNRGPGHPFANDPVLTPERIGAIIKGYKLRGATYKGAVVAAGIAHRTGKKWLARGHDDYDAGEATLYAQLYREIELVRAQKVRRLYRISLTAEGAHAASARWWAERLDPDSLHLTAKHEVSGPEGAPIPHQHDVSSGDLLAALDAFARGLATTGDGPGDAGAGGGDADPGAARDPRA